MGLGFVVVRNRTQEEINAILSKKVTDSIKSMTRELGGMTVVAEDEYGAMQQLVGLSAQMIHNFERLKQGMYKIKLWAEIGGKKFVAQQACVDKIRHAVGEAVELLPDMVHLDPAFTEIYSDSVHSKLAGPAEGLATEMKTYLLQVWVKLVNNAFVQFLRLCARKWMLLCIRKNRRLLPSSGVAWGIYPELRELASRMISEFAGQSIPGRNVTRMQFQLAVYADIVVEWIGDDVAMGAKVMLLDEVLQVHRGLSEVLYTAFNGKDQVLGLMQDVNQACRRKALQTSLVALEAARCMGTKRS
ncbi:hypothetical protein WJX77_008105 [Trebouxia sp. C0004]